MANPKPLVLKLAEAWDAEAWRLERRAKAPGDLTAIERRLLEMDARVKRACAQDARLAHQAEALRGR